METKTKTINIIVTPSVSDSISRFFKDRKSGLRFLVESFDDLYKRTISEMKGMFSENELLLMLEAHADVELIEPHYAGIEFLERIIHVSELCRLIRRWDIEDEELLYEKIGQLHLYDCVCLEMLFVNFWNNIPDEEKDAQEYIEILL